jgi:photosystem II stability/assembly factor-like uncharacterized protein
MNKFLFTLSILLLLNLNSFGQWQNLAQPTTRQLAAVSFVSADTGYIGGSSGKIYKTTNGGTNWTSLTSGTSNNVFSIVFSDNLNGNACTGVAKYGSILNTTDGGKTWKAKASSDDYLIDLFFVNDKIGFCVGYIGKILKTTDGGQNWTAQSSGTTQDLRGVYFIDEDTGFIAAEHNEILKTTDGGSTWKSYPSGTSNILLAISFIDSKTGIAAGGKGAIVRTTDGGITWTEQAITHSEYYQKIYFVDSQRGYIVGGRGLISTTLDGGKSWYSKYYGNFSSTYGWYDITFADTTGYVVGYNGSIAMTTCTPTNSTDVQTACKSFTWMDGKTYTSSTNAATYALTNKNNCDSIVTLHLTIPEIDTSVTLTGSTIKSNAIGATYQWIDCGNGNAPISGETKQNFTASKIGTYAAIVTINNCSDTTTCITISKVGSVGKHNFQDWSIYPNPNDGTVNIDFGATIPDGSIKVFDAYGQLLMQFDNINKRRSQFAFNEPTGLYFIRAEVDGIEKVFRLIKN